MTDRSEDATLREMSDLPERQAVQIQLVEDIFVELAQTHKHAETNFQAGHKLILLKDYRAAMRCFEDCSFYLTVLSRRYGTMGANIRQLRESICLADHQEELDAEIKKQGFVKKIQG